MAKPQTQPDTSGGFGRGGGFSTPGEHLERFWTGPSADFTKHAAKNNVMQSVHSGRLEPCLELRRHETSNSSVLGMIRTVLQTQFAAARPKAFLNPVNAVPSTNRILVTIASIPLQSDHDVSVILQHTGCVLLQILSIFVTRA